MRASPFSLSLVAAAVAGFSFPHLVDTMERLLGSVQASPAINDPSEHAVYPPDNAGNWPTSQPQAAAATERLGHADLPAPRFPLLLAGSVIPQAIAEMPVTEMPATNSGLLVAEDRVELPMQPRTDLMVRTKAVARAATQTRIAPKPPRRPQFQADGISEGPFPAIFQLFDSAHRELERVAGSIRTR